MGKFFSNFIDGILEAIVSPVMNFLTGTIDKLILNEGLSNVFFIEESLGLSNDFMLSLRRIILAFALALLTCKLLFKLFNIYILGTDGDNTTSPIEYLKSYVKGIFIALTFTVFYGWMGEICRDFSGQLSELFGEQDWKSLFSAINPAGTGFFMLIYVIVCGYFLITFTIMGIRMFFLRMAIPLACTGLIDNDNGLYSAFMKKLMQTAITALAQLFLFQLSMMPLKSADGGTLSLVLSIAIILFAIKIPTDLNDIFIGAPATGAGQKVSAIGRGVQGVSSLLKRG